MLKTFDGVSTKRVGGKSGDRTPTQGIIPFESAKYTATGGETEVDLSLLNPALSYQPGLNQIFVFRGNGGKVEKGGFYETSPSKIGFPANDPLEANEVVEFVIMYGISGVVVNPNRDDAYAAIVSETPVARLSTHTTVTQALADVADGDEILILNGTYVENVTVSKKVKITGQGINTIINGTWTFASGSEGAKLRDTHHLDDIFVNSGVTGIEVAGVFLAIGKTFKDSNMQGNDLSGLQEY